MSTPLVSAIRLNECPLPSTRVRVLAATISWSSSTLAGKRSSAAENSMLRAQFTGCAAIYSTHRLAARRTADAHPIGIIRPGPRLYKLEDSRLLHRPQAGR